MIVAVFLVILGLFSIILFSPDKADDGNGLSRRNGAFLISTAQGAENMAVLLGAQEDSPLSAIADNYLPDQRSIFSATSGAIKDRRIGPARRSLTAGGVGFIPT